MVGPLVGMLPAFVLLAAAAELKRCYWYDGFDARDPPPGTSPTRNTGWNGPGLNCTAGPESPKPCTAEDCCAKCQSPETRHPKTGEACAFSIWNPTASSCFFKTEYAVPFAKPGDVTCCPDGAVACPSQPPGGPWRLRTDFSDEFAVSTNLSNVGQPYSILPLNTSKWATDVASWGDWTWDPANVRTVAQLPGAPNDDTSGYAAITMRYEEHTRDGKPYFCERGRPSRALPPTHPPPRRRAPHTTTTHPTRFPGLRLMTCCRQVWHHEEPASGGHLLRSV